MLPIQLVIPEIVPRHNTESRDVQFHQSQSGSYSVLEYRPDGKIVFAYTPNVRVLQEIAKKKGINKTEEDSRSTDGPDTDASHESDNENGKMNEFATGTKNEKMIDNFIQKNKTKLDRKVNRMNNMVIF